MSEPTAPTEPTALAADLPSDLASGAPPAADAQRDADASAEDPAEPTAPFRSPRMWAKLTTAAFGVYALVNLYWLHLGLRGLEMASTVAGGGEIDAAVATRFDLRVEQAEQAGYAALALCATMFCLFFHRAVSNVASFGRTTRFSPGMAVGCFFIPVLNLWRPYQAAAETWQASDPEGRYSGDVYLSAAAPAPLWMAAWWILWLAARAVGRFAAQFLEDAVTAEQWASATRWAMGATAMDTAALVLAVVLVWKLTGRQEARALPQLPTARVIA